MRHAVRVLVVLVAAGLGALLALGCFVAALFELEGFGGPRDEGSRAGYLALLGLGLVVSVGAPLLLWRALFPASAPAWGLAALPLAAGVLLVLGITLGR